MTAFAFDKLVIFGVGLIGGSLARALRVQQGGGARRIVGVERDERALARALELGVIDAGVPPDDDAALAAALADADVVVLAAPVAQMHALFERIASRLGAATVVTDAGSTKTDVAAAARAALGARAAQFVPGHPIAGREKSGVDAALADLFVDRHVVLCPAADNARAAVEQVAAMWRAAGARVSEMTVEQHDRVFASVSHLPHVLSFALVEQILASPDAALKFSFAAGGFRDFTRIAASSPEMWRDVCIANRSALLAELDGYTAVLARLRAAIEAGDGATLEAVFARSRAAREAWQERGGAPGPADGGRAQ